MEFPIKYECKDFFDQEMVRELNGICLFIKERGWSEGNRNNLSVNVCICQHALGLNISDPFGIWLSKTCGSADCRDYFERKEVIDEYVDGWDDNLSAYGFNVDWYIDHWYKNEREIRGDAADVLIVNVRKNEEDEPIKIKEDN